MTDYIVQIRRCIQLLDEQALTEWSAKLADAIEAASTGGELVMAVRWVLRELVAAEPDVDGDVRALVSDILEGTQRTGW